MTKVKYKAKRGGGGAKASTSSKGSLVRYTLCWVVVALTRKTSTKSGMKIG